MMPAPEITVEKLKNIQALRAIAALLVLWAHLKFPAASVPGHVLPAWLQSSAGASGVDLFFVISGYVISLTAVRHGQGAWHFFRNRFARIAPLNYALTLALLVRFWRHPHPGEVMPGLNQFWNSFFFLPVFDLGSFSLPINPLAWSLCFEMWFYLALALLLAITTAGRAVRWLPLVLLAGVLLAPLSTGTWYLPHFLAHPLCLEFALGCLIFTGQRFLSDRISWLMLGAGLLLFIFLVPRFSSLGWFTNAQGIVPAPIGDNYFLFWKRVLVWGLPSGLLLAGLLGLERSETLVLPRLLIVLGDASYSLYLIQPLTIRGSFSIAQTLHATRVWQPVLLFIMMTLVLGLVSWQLVERPLRHLARRCLGIAPRESLAGEPTLSPERGRK